MRKFLSLLFLLSAALCAAQLRAEVIAGVAPQKAPQKKLHPVDARWQASLQAFADADQAQAPQPGGVLFVGSSSIRLWDGLETQFDRLAVTKRGFGGSRLQDCADYLDRLVLPYKPRMVVVYAGDNDLAEGRTPQQVLDSFRAFVDGVHAELPGTRIAYLSIKPSPLRANLIPQIREANALIAEYARAHAGLDYIDIYTQMLDADGRPRADLYSADALHMNADGYKLWQRTIAPHLNARPDAVPPAAARVAAAAS